MTDTIPFSPAQAVDEDDAQANRKKVMVAGGAVALLLAAGGYFFLSGGSSAPAETPIAKGHPRVAVVGGSRTVAKTASKAAPKPVTLPATSTARLGRDPFKPLVTPPVAAPAGTGTGAAAGTSGPATTTTTDGSTGTTTTSSTATAPYALKLSTISSAPTGARTYTFGYGTTSKRVIAGQKFGKYGEIVVLAPVLDSHSRVVGALIQVGDADPKSMATGSKATVA